MISTASGAGQWILFENIHLCDDNDLKKLKKALIEIEWGENDRKFKLWLSFFLISEKYKEKNLNCKNKGNNF